jgi:rubrerythrin
MNNEAIKELVNDILEQEDSMLKLYERLINGTDEEEILNVLRPIASDEGKHIGNAKKMLSIIEGE